MENNAVEVEFPECDTAIDVDSVNWGAVAKAYKLIRLFPLKGCEEEESGGLRRKYMGWFLSRLGSVEFDIALRMAFEECITSEYYRAHAMELLREVEMEI